MGEIVPAKHRIGQDWRNVLGKFVRGRRFHYGNTQLHRKHFVWQMQDDSLVKSLVMFNYCVHTHRCMKWTHPHTQSIAIKHISFREIAHFIGSIYTCYLLINFLVQKIRLNACVACSCVCVVCGYEIKECHYS